MSPRDFLELTPLQKAVLILNWNEEKKREQQDQQKWDGQLPKPLPKWPWRRRR
jgi:hypothetical protein